MSDKEFVFFEKQTVHHEGDERSRTNPGHGYPAYTEEFTTPVFAKDEEDLKQKLENYTRFGYNRKMPEVFRLTPVEVSSEIVVKIK